MVVQAGGLWRDGGLEGHHQKDTRMAVDAEHSPAGTEPVLQRLSSLSAGSSMRVIVGVGVACNR